MKSRKRKLARGRRNNRDDLIHHLERMALVGIDDEDTRCRIKALAEAVRGKRSRGRPTASSTKRLAQRKKEHEEEKVYDAVALEFSPEFNSLDVSILTAIKHCVKNAKEKLAAINMKRSEKEIKRRGRFSKRAKALTLKVAALAERLRLARPGT